eukprot:1158818-Pelagomonas_calceolata.AAC.1
MSKQDVDNQPQLRPGASYRATRIRTKAINQMWMSKQPTNSEPGQTQHTAYLCNLDCCRHADVCVP